MSGQKNKGVLEVMKDVQSVEGRMMQLLAVRLAVPRMRDYHRLYLKM
jgi:hypothetical protein